MTRPQVGTIYGMPVYDGDDAPPLLASPTNIDAWFRHVLCKYDKDFAFESAVMGPLWIFTQYSSMMLRERYAKIVHLIPASGTV